MQDIQPTDIVATIGPASSTGLFQATSEIASSTGLSPFRLPCSVPPSQFLHAGTVVRALLAQHCQPHQPDLDLQPMDGIRSSTPSTCTRSSRLPSQTDAWPWSSKTTGASWIACSHRSQRHYAVSVPCEWKITQERPSKVSRSQWFCY